MICANYKRMQEYADDIKKIFEPLVAEVLDKRPDDIVN